MSSTRSWTRAWSSISIYVRVSLVGIELLTVDARIVIASVDTYLRFAEAVNRLDISESDPKTDLPGLVDDVVGGAVQSGAKRKTAGAIDAVKERVEEVFSRDEHEDRND